MLPSDAKKCSNNPPTREIYGTLNDRT